MYQMPFIAAVLASASLLSASSGVQPSEGAIRQASQNTQVIGSAGQQLLFTISGKPNDQITTPFFCGKLKDAPHVTNVVIHSDGNRSYRFCVRFKAAWAGQTVTVSRDGTLIDSDPVVCQ